jgi:SNF2 family DNA or RNA helicase
MVVVPTSLLTNWRKEIEKFAPSLVVGIYHGAVVIFSPKITTSL